MLEGRPFNIEKGDIATVVDLSRLLPEFEDPCGADEYERRLKNVKHLILLAYFEGKVVGFKVGYDHIVFKTRNQHKAMLVFALKNGFDIIGFSEKEKVSANRILLRKSLCY